MCSHSHHENPPRLLGATVWAVDDDSSVRDALDALCTSAQYRFRGFATAEAVLECILPSPPACLLLDVDLPGMSGLELQNLLNARDSIPVPIIFVSALDLPHAQCARDAGAVDFLHKPFDHEVLLADIRCALQQSVAMGRGS